jgi:hypothetical protein
MCVVVVDDDDDDDDDDRVGSKQINIFETSSNSKDAILIVQNQITNCSRSRDNPNPHHVFHDLNVYSCSHI